MATLLFILLSKKYGTMSKEASLGFVGGIVLDMIILLLLV